MHKIQEIAEQKYDAIHKMRDAIAELRERVDQINELMVLANKIVEQADIAMEAIDAEIAEVANEDDHIVKAIILENEYAEMKERAKHAQAFADALMQGKYKVK